MRIVDTLLNNNEQMSCPVCLGKSNTRIREIFDDRYGQPDIFNLVRCTQCGHLMTAPRLDESQLGDLYGTYYPRKHININDLKNEAALSIRPMARWRRWWSGTDNQGQYTVRPGELMLDIGCGSGLSLLEAKAVGADVRGVEADPNVHRIATELGLKIHIGSLLDEPFPGEQFDLVVLNQVIEHMPDPALMLERLRPRLKPGGRMILVFPNVNSLWCRIFGKFWINWHVPYHLHHFTRAGFSKMVSRTGYRIRKVRTITPNLWTILQLRACKINVKPGVPSPLWNVSAADLKGFADEGEIVKSRRTIKRILRGVVKRTIRTGMMVTFSFMNRFIDTIGCGDSLMVEIAPE